MTVIPSLPYTDTGTTAGYNDDFTTICFPGGSAPDVVYRFTPNVDMTVDVSLCGSSYNTVLSVWRDCPGTDQPILICCNDDSPDCAPQSCCSGIDLARSIAYYFVVDGAPGQSGNYQLTVDLSVLPSCFVGTGCVVCPPALHTKPKFARRSIRIPMPGQRVSAAATRPSPAVKRCAAKPRTQPRGWTKTHTGLH